MFGQAGFEPGMAKNTYGTGSFVLLNVGPTCPPPTDGMLTTIAWELADGTVVVADTAYLTRAIADPSAELVADYNLKMPANRLSDAEIADIVGLIVMRDGPQSLHIENIAVDPECHGRGYGRALLDFAEEEAARRGYGALDLYTNAKMRENLALYLALGNGEMARAAEALPFERAARLFEDGGELRQAAEMYDAAGAWSEAARAFAAYRVNGCYRLVDGSRLVLGYGSIVLAGRQETCAKSGKCQKEEFPHYGSSSSY